MYLQVVWRSVNRLTLTPAWRVPEPEPTSPLLGVANADHSDGLAAVPGSSSVFGRTQSDTPRPASYSQPPQLAARARCHGLPIEGRRGLRHGNGGTVPVTRSMISRYEPFLHNVFPST